MATNTFFRGLSKLAGFLLADGIVVQKVAVVDGDGNASGAGTASSPTVTQSQGAGNIATSQATTSVANAAALLLVAARSGRQSVTLTNITGTQPVYLMSSAGTGTATGFFLAGTAGAQVTINTTAAIYGTSPTAAQTIAVIETY